jgi:hypothetical protein
MNKKEKYNKYSNAMKNWMWSLHESHRLLGCFQNLLWISNSYFADSSLERPKINTTRDIRKKVLLGSGTSRGRQRTKGKVMKEVTRPRKGQV